MIILVLMMLLCVLLGVLNIWLGAAMLIPTIWIMVCKINKYFVVNYPRDN